MYTDSFYWALIISILLCLASAVSVTLFVTYKLLSKYNDFGDSACDINEYSRFGINIDRMRDDVVPQEKYDFFLYYGDNPYENAVHSIPEQLLKNGEKPETESIDDNL
jgi:hypothetical protein